MPITTGSAPKALSGPYSKVADQSSDNDPLIQAIQRVIPQANKKPPKIKKRAFGPSLAGAAFRK